MNCCMTFLMLLTAGLAYATWKLFVLLWWRPQRIQQIFRAQGIGGPEYRMLYGSMSELIAMMKEACSSPMPCVSHDIVGRVKPDILYWGKKYGSPFVYFLGLQPTLSIADVGMVKEIMVTKAANFFRVQPKPAMKDLMGNGLLLLNGDKWAHHRRIINPAFYVDKVKSMAPMVAACVEQSLLEWQKMIHHNLNQQVELDVHHEFMKLAAHLIARTAFGSSFEEGKQAFQLQKEQLILYDKAIRSVDFPGLSYLPTATNRYRWRLEKRMQRCLRRIIESKRDKQDGRDLLGLMMAANKATELSHGFPNHRPKLGMGEIVDECKGFFLAGHETTANHLTWTLMLLSLHTEWQEKTRQEVLAICGKEAPPAGDSLSSLKILSMVMNESLRLYPPLATLLRQTMKDTKMESKGVVIPKGTVVAMSLLAIHHDEEVWGKDVNEFKPERFTEGGNKSSSMMAFLPYSMGLRSCIGQSFAVMETKVVLAMILQRFHFHLSHTYQHAPTICLTLQPQHGVQIVFRNL